MLKTSNLAMLRVWLPDKRYRVGTAYAVTPTIVITAAHVVLGTSNAQVWPDKIEVRFVNEVSWKEAEVIPIWSETNIDVCLIQLRSINQDFSHLSWGEYVRGNPAEWHSAGFPLAAKSKEKRDTADVRGQIFPFGAIRQDMYELGVIQSPSNPEDWAGLSGAPVFSGEHLTAIISTAVFGGVRFQATPVHRLLSNANFFEIVGSPELYKVQGNLYSTQQGKPIKSYNTHSIAPVLPAEFTGRSDDIKIMQKRLLAPSHANSKMNVQVVTAVSGWPGVGKTTFASALAHNAKVRANFPDGILWATVGPDPKLLNITAAWLRALGVQNEVCSTITEDSGPLLLTGQLIGKRVLLILDDVWDEKDAEALRVGGEGCAMIITTRLKSVANEMTIPDLVHQLGLLSFKHSHNLLKQLAPSVCDSTDPSTIKRLLIHLEGLPLGIQVAGRLLEAEQTNGLPIGKLLDELIKGSLLLQSQAPKDRMDLLTHTTPTVAALLEMSTDRLDPMTRHRFAMLGTFKEVPASFSLKVLAKIWETSTPEDTVRVLNNRGLIQFAGEGRYQIHSLLKLHARQLLSALSKEAV